MKGFTLIEILIYISIFVIIGGLSIGILLTITQINTRESAVTEVTGQLNFLTQTINRLVKSSSNIEITAASTTSVLKLRMQDPAKDPTCISLVNGVAKLAEGPNVSSPQNCTSNTSNLTSDRVVVNTLDFKKSTQYPGHDSVSVVIAITYNSNTPQSQIQRVFQLAIARVSAATFDSDVLPGSAYNFNLGQAGAPWKDVYLSGVLNLGTAASDPTGQNGSMYYNTSSNAFRGYKNGAWADLGGSGSSYWNNSGTNIYNTNSGNVGVGTSTPATKFSVSGAISQTYAINCNIKVDTSGMFYCQSSSERYKKDIQDLNFNVNDFLSLEPRTFQYKENLPFKVEGTQVGLIAEETEKIFPQLVIYKNGQPEGIKYDEIPIYLYSVVQQQQKEIENLKEQVQELKASR